jgi:hypothetical protein
VDEFLVRLECFCMSHSLLLLSFSVSFHLVTHAMIDLSDVIPGRVSGNHPSRPESVSCGWTSRSKSMVGDIHGIDVEFDGADVGRLCDDDCPVEA